MGVIAIFAGCLLSNAALPIVTVKGHVERVDVGYAELMRGDTAAAVKRIRASRTVLTDNPAALINLGSAYVRLGHPEKAKDLYLAAIVSAQRYELELADGTWMDSRRAARLAIGKLQQGQAIALR